MQSTLRVEGEYTPLAANLSVLARFASMYPALLDTYKDIHYAAKHLHTYKYITVVGSFAVKDVQELLEEFPEFTFRISHLT